MNRIGIEAISVTVALTLAVVAMRFPVSTEEDVNFWIVLIGAGAIWEGCRFFLRNKFINSPSNGS
ncbi:hypothetical protein WBP06_26025 [Novosphingobium sp. BL-8H]|uniref:hypothetical protein n=1 Tax=Novosphingobium sp. BL-8H TaxID=3127640 RepID=UPI0037576014